jgi:YspA, cpYpsA-related SLOG family
MALHGMTIGTPDLVAEPTSANQLELGRLRAWLRDTALERPGWRVRSFAVTGSREWIDWRIVWNTLWCLPVEATLLHGRAYGLDCLAQAFHRERGGTAEPFSATQQMWGDLGKRAGVVRNEIMLNRMPDLLLGFIRDNSPGSSHAVAYARKLEIPTFVFRAV